MECAVNDVLKKFGRCILILFLLLSSFWITDNHLEFCIQNDTNLLKDFPAVVM